MSSVNKFQPQVSSRPKRRSTRRPATGGDDYPIQIDPLSMHEADGGGRNMGAKALGRRWRSSGQMIDLVHALSSTAIRSGISLVQRRKLLLTTKTLI